MQCLKCGYAFEDHSGIVIIGSYEGNITGNRTTCPNCGGLALQAKSGQFEVDEDGTWRHLAEVLTAPQVTKKDYEDLASLLRNAQDLGTSKEDVAREIRQTVPHLAPVASILEQKEYLGTWIGVLISVLMLILGLYSEFNEPDQQPVNVTVVVEQPSAEQVREWIKSAAEEAHRTNPPPQERPHNNR